MRDFLEKRRMPDCIKSFTEVQGDGLANACIWISLWTTGPLNPLAAEQKCKTGQVMTDDIHRYNNGASAPHQVR